MFKRKVQTMFNKRITSGALVLVLATLSFGFRACAQSEKDRNLAFARDLAGSLEAAIPLVRSKSPAIAARLELSLATARSLIAAIEASNAPDVARLVREILPAFTEAVRAFTNDRNILLALALGQIALNFFVNRFVLSSATPFGADSAIIDAYTSLPQFGCELKPERCKH